MSNSEVTRYMLECIFEVWVKVFTDSIANYPKSYSFDFIKYAYSFLNIIKKKVIYYKINVVQTVEKLGIII